MFYNVFEPKKEIDCGNEKFLKKIFLESDTGALCGVEIKKDEIIDTHTSNRDAAVYVLEGEIELHFEAEKFKVKKEEMILFKKETEHKVLALKDSKFLIIKI